MVSLKHLLVRCQNYFTVKLAIAFKVKTTNAPRLKRIGSSYGGWWIPLDYIDTNQTNQVAISVGIGHDVSFDKILLESGFLVIALDPLEECVEYARSELAHGFKNLHIEQLGLAVRTGVQVLYPPKNSSHDAWSATNSQNVDEALGRQFQVLPSKNKSGWKLNRAPKQKRDWRMSKK